MKKEKEKVVMVSGGFDPLHIGHVRLFKEAKKHGDRLVVVLNNDHWIRRKKGIEFMPAQERKEIIEALDCVDRVILSGHSKNPKDMSVSKELHKLKPNVFANGGDRNEKDAANPRSSLYKDLKTCRKLGIKMIFNVGEGGKLQSSSDLLRNYLVKNGHNGNGNGH